MESQAMNFHDETGKAFDKFKLKAGDDAGDVAWTEVSGNVDLYANHKDMIHKVAELHDAYFWVRKLALLQLLKPLIYAAISRSNFSCKFRTLYLFFRTKNCLLYINPFVVIWRKR